MICCFTFCVVRHSHSSTFISATSLHGLLSNLPLYCDKDIMCMIQVCVPNLGFGYQIFSPEKAGNSRSRAFKTGSLPVPSNSYIPVPVPPFWEWSPVSSSLVSFGTELGNADLKCMTSTQWLVGIYNDTAKKSWSKYTTLKK